MYKICFVTTVSITLKSFVVELAKYLHGTGEFEIHFICDHDAEFAQSLPGYIHYKPIAMKRGVSFDGMKAMLAMLKYFKEERFDLVQYSTPNASLYAAVAAKLAHIPCRLYCQWGIAYVGFRGIKRKIFKLVEKIVCMCSTQIEPDSFGNLHFSHAEKLYGAGKSSVVGNGSASGVNLEKFDITHKEAWRDEIRRRYKIPGDAFVYIFIGRITKDKGVNELLEAAKSLLCLHRDAYLLLVGDAEKVDSISPELYSWSKQEERVLYTGFTNEVEKYLAASDVYVLPSYREGFGTSIIEAEAMSVPVIVTNIPGPTEAMTKDVTGLVVEKGNAAQLCGAMEKLYGSGEMCREMGKNGAEFASGRFEQKWLFSKVHEDRVALVRRCMKNA